MSRVRQAIMILCVSLFLIGWQRADGNIACWMESSVTVQPGQACPGDALLIRSPHFREIRIFGNTVTLQKTDGEYIGFVPVPLQTHPGTYPLTTVSRQVLATVQVLPKNFPFDNLTVSETMHRLWEQKNRIQSDQAKLKKARSNSTPYPSFLEAFSWPAYGRLSTPFGYQRIVNGVPQSRHLGIDIANEEGTAIVSTHDGNVVLVDEFLLNGKIVVIDHGLGIYSAYSHLQDVFVKKGETVRQGDIIGNMGSTGFSTGPHLHFSIYVHQQPVNPIPFFEHSPFAW